MNLMLKGILIICTNGYIPEWFTKILKYRHFEEMSYDHNLKSRMGIDEKLTAIEDVMIKAMNY